MEIGCDNDDITDARGLGEKRSTSQEKSKTEAWKSAEVGEMPPPVPPSLTVAQGKIAGILIFEKGLTRWESEIRLVWNHRPCFLCNYPEIPFVLE